VLLLVSLDLQIVGGYSGLGTAGIFTPMTVAMVAAGPVDVHAAHAASAKNTSERKAKGIRTA